MKIINKVIIVVTVFVALVGLEILLQKQKVEIRDVSSPIEFIIKKRPWQGNVYGIKICVEGDIDSEAALVLFVGDDGIHTIKIDRNLPFKWSTELYSNRVAARYNPKNAKTGNLIIRYEFCGTDAAMLFR